MKNDSTIDVVCFGESLWDVLPTGALPGGAPMNVAYHLKKLGIRPGLITKVGDDDYGRDLIKIMEAAGIQLHCEVDTEHPTGVVNVIEGENHEMSYDIAFPAAWDFIRWQQSCDDLVAGADCFVFGTLSNRYHVTRETLFRLLTSSKQNVFDVNLRPPHFQQTGIEVLLKETNILKMNLAELHLITDWYDRAGNTEDRMKFLRHRFEIDTIIVTKGAAGAKLLTEACIIDHPGYQIKVLDTIGSGDAFLSGFLARRLHGDDAETALDFAAAIGAYVATRAGGTPEYKVEDITELMKPA